MKVGLTSSFFKRHTAAVPRLKRRMDALGGKLNTPVSFSQDLLLPLNGDCPSISSEMKTRARRHTFREGLAVAVAAHCREPFALWRQ